RSGINVSTNAGSNARTSPDLADQQKQLTVRSRFSQARTCFSIAADVIRSAASGDSSRWSMRMPLFFGQRRPDEQKH
ncbi:hypothetical protein, partial [Rhizobium aethiopicum]|uniref:hypothetical protein n=1 Tax=Rhizobium aethiopicum TaxID=1138170 RepID=UPI001AEE6550